MKRLLVGLLMACAVPTMAADPTLPFAESGPAWTASLYSGTVAVLTRVDRREFVSARATIAGPVFGGLSAFSRLDLSGTQDGGSLADPNTFRTMELASGLWYDLGPIQLTGLGGVTFSVEGEEGAPQDARLYTGALLARIDLGDGGYAFGGGGWYGPVGGWALLGAVSIPAGPAFATIDYAIPLDRTTLSEKRWVLKVGAQVRVKRIRLGG